jgi:hypothetical protein
MMSRICVVWSGLVALTGCQHIEHRNISVPDFYVLGTLHSMHLTARYRYSLTDLEAEIRALAPDLICGEIVRSAVGAKTEGLFPPEAALLAQVAESVPSTFAAVDWRADFEGNSGRVVVEPPVPAHVESLRRQLLDRLEHFDAETVFDLLHGDEFGALTRQIHEGWIDAAGEAADGFSVTRNRRIVENCLEAARLHRSHRVVFAFGQDHQYAIKDELKAHGLVGKSPPRMFRPSSMPAPDAVIQRWVRNRAALEGLVKDPTTPEAVRNMGSRLKRMQELTRFIETKGQAQ